MCNSSCTIDCFPPIAGTNKRSNSEGYRDTWSEEGLLKQADLDFQQQLAVMTERVL
jgi:hypothetical protein